MIIPVGAILLHIKSMPLVYTVRLLILFRVLLQRAKANKLKPRPLFSIMTEEHRCYLDDIDYNRHMNNSMYNKALDFSRFHFLFSICPRVLVEPQDVFAHNGGVITLFIKEIPSLSKYKVESRIWTWNEKWMFVQHRFLRAGDQVACIAFSKLVFKTASGKTLQPKAILELCGHEMTEAVEERRAFNWNTAKHILALDETKRDPYAWSKI
ncbi:hypothetical protein BDB01DRAFT_730423 [Pilobolus umbonatus]|nr:hypothetical protein BDB01DRAFT_730423 [Pilobolus umbonatus]